MLNISIEFNKKRNKQCVGCIIVVRRIQFVCGSEIYMALQIYFQMEGTDKLDPLKYKWKMKSKK